MLKKINKLLVTFVLAGAIIAAVPLVPALAIPGPGAGSTPTQPTAPAGTVCKDTAATCGRCYNQLAGTAYYCSGGQFVPGSCWVYNNNGGVADWSAADCKLSQFASIQTGSVGQTAVTADQAACGSSTGACCKDKTNNNSDCGIISRINQIISFLALTVGVAAALGIIIGGIEYSSSGGDPKKTASGKSHITKAVIAVVLFGFLYTFLEFIIPGGFLNG